RAVHFVLPYGTRLDPASCAGAALSLLRAASPAQRAHACLRHERTRLSRHAVRLIVPLGGSLPARPAAPGTRAAAGALRRHAHHDLPACFPPALFLEARMMNSPFFCSRHRNTSWMACTPFFFSCAR